MTKTRVQKLRRLEDNVVWRAVLKESCTQWKTARPLFSSALLSLFPLLPPSSHHPFPSSRPSSFCRAPPSALLQVLLFSGVFGSVPFVFGLSSLVMCLQFSLLKLFAAIGLEVIKCHRSHFGSRYTLGWCACAGLFVQGFIAGEQKVNCYESMPAIQTISAILQEFPLWRNPCIT